MTGIRLVVLLLLTLYLTTAGARSNTGTATVDDLAMFAQVFSVAAYFSPSDTASSIDDWNRVALSGAAECLRSCADSLTGTLLRVFSPLGVSLSIESSSSTAKVAEVVQAPVFWIYDGPGFPSQTRYSPYSRMRVNRDGNNGGTSPVNPPAPARLSLGDGRWLVVQLQLSIADALHRLSPGSQSLPEPSNIAAPEGTAAKVADVFVAWSAVRHFYPYQEAITSSWHDILRDAIRAALGDGTRADHIRTIRRMLAPLVDGHAFVEDRSQPRRRGTLPFRLFTFDGHTVVHAAATPLVPVGSEVVGVNRRAVAERLGDEVSLLSGSPQWKLRQALDNLLACDVGSNSEVTILAGTSLRTVHLPCEVTEVREGRPAVVIEIRPGIVYVDLTRLTEEILDRSLSQILSARGMILDLRGYPQPSATRLLSHLLKERDSHRWMHIPQISEPFFGSVSWKQIGWNQAPAEPRFTGSATVLIDARAISYSESLISVLKDHALAQLVGTPTAGANGNLVALDLPSRIRIAFTGMRVTHHDEQTPYHGKGIAPDVWVEPTINGIRQGADEVLERAIAIASIQQ